MKRTNLLDIDFDTPSMKFMDWALTAASFGVYFYTWNWLWLAAGAAGAVASWYRPIGRFQKYLKRRVVRRTAGSGRIGIGA